MAEKEWADLHRHKQGHGNVSALLRRRWAVGFVAGNPASSSSSFYDGTFVLYFYSDGSGSVCEWRVVAGGGGEKKSVVV